MDSVVTSPAGVIDIPDGALLQGVTFENLRKSFEETWGFAADTVCLPIATTRKLYFESSAGYERRSIRYGPNNDEYELPGAVTVAAQAGLNVILSVSAMAPYTGFGAGDIVDITGGISSQSCPWNPDMRGLLGDVVSEAMTQSVESLAHHGLESRLVGLAVDACDLWPMSAEGARIELTCFCRHCRDYLRVEGVDTARFEHFPNPWNLCLRDSGTGISYMGDVWIGDDPQALVDRSARRGFLEVYRSFAARSDTQLADDADALIRYMRVRHRQTTAVLTNLFGRAAKVQPSSGLRRVVVTEGDPWDWTGGTFLEALDDPAICDELWFDIGDQNIKPARVGFRPYMWRRSRYGIDAFFDFLEQSSDRRFMASTGMGRRTQVELAEMLRVRARVALSGSIRIRAIAKLVQQWPTYLGLVDPALDGDWVDRIAADWTVPE